MADNESTDQNSQLGDVIQKLDYLGDLFVRRLRDDKDKAHMLSELSEQNAALQRTLDDRTLESLFRELLLVLDRIEAQAGQNDFMWSIYDEILEVFARRDIRLIDEAELDMFDPHMHKAIGTVPATEEQPYNTIARIQRNGYRIRDRVLRPAEVIVAVPSTQGQAE